jgi:flagellar biosynthetic protein FliQ
MQIEAFLHIARQGVETAVLVSSPVLLSGLAAGVLVSVFQAATQISDASLAFIPKIMAVVASLIFFGPWMITKMAAFSTYAFNQIPLIYN